MTTQPRALDITDSQLELAKWLAILTMVIDHVGYVFADMVDYMAFRMLGRICWPLIAFIVAMRLFVSPTRTSGYLRRLLPWAVIAQLPYAFIFLFPRQEPWYETFNIFVTIALGCLVFILLERWRKAASQPEQLLCAVGILIAVTAGVKVDYGPVGVITIPVLALLARQSTLKAAIACGLFALLSNTLYMIGAHSLSANWPMLAGTLAASVIACVTLNEAGSLWRLPRWFFYAFYPVHMIILIAARVWVDWDTIMAAHRNLPQ